MWSAQLLTSSVVGVRGVRKVLKWMGMASFQNIYLQKPGGRLDLAGWDCKLLSLDPTELPLITAIGKSFSTKVWDDFTYTQASICTCVCL